MYTNLNLILKVIQHLI